MSRPIANIQQNLQFQSNGGHANREYIRLSNKCGRSPDRLSGIEILPCGFSVLQVLLPWCS